MRISKIVILATGAVLVAAFQNCSKVGFKNSGMAGQTISSIGQCSVSTTAEALRIIFMVDNSGSTTTTDPSMTDRTTSLQNFLSNYSGHTNLTYGFGYFSGTTAQLYDTATKTFSANAVTPFGVASDLSAATKLFAQVTPVGDTPYKAAFTAMNAAVAADADAGDANYVVRSSWTRT